MKYAKTNNLAKSPKGNRTADSGIDFFVPDDWNNGKEKVLRLGEQVNIALDIKTRFKPIQSLIFMNKSGVALKKGLTVGAQVIDFSYTGIVHANMFKVVKGTEDIRVRKRGILGILGFKEWATVIHPGEKIVQGILFNISTESINEIKESVYNKNYKSDRGAKGFGEGTGQK